MSLLEHPSWVDSREKPRERNEYLDLLAARAAGAVAAESEVDTSCSEYQTHFMPEKDDVGFNRFPFTA